MQQHAHRGVIRLVSLFGIAVDDLLTVDGKRLRPAEVYRKVSAVSLAVLASATEKKK